MSTSLCVRIFEHAGNTISDSGGQLRCGHEPEHSSRSAACVSIDTEKDYFKCFNPGCDQGGGPVKALMGIEGCSWDEAVKTIKARYGVDLSSPRGTIIEELADVVSLPTNWLWP